MQGTIFENYKVLEQIRQDELSTTFLATDTKLGTDVELKVLREIKADSARAFFRLCKEDARQSVGSGKPSILNFGVASSGQAYAIYAKQSE